MTYTVTLKPSDKQFSVDPGESVLEAALRQAVVLPYGCKNGACGSCKALLVSGSVLAGEVLLGWHSFELGGIVAIPYAIPALVLIVMLMVANAKTR